MRTKGYDGTRSDKRRRDQAIPGAVIGEGVGSKGKGGTGRGQRGNGQEKCPPYKPAEHKKNDPALTCK